MIRATAHRPAVVWAVCVALLVAGALAFSRLPLATRTAVELPRLQVMATWPGAAPEVIETYLTSPIEAAVQGVRGVRRVSSTSTDDAALLTVSLHPTADVQMTRLAILERLELLRRDLPPGVAPPSVDNYVPQGLEEAPLLTVTIGGPYTPGALQKLLNERVGPRLASVAGVAGVAVRGGTDLGVAVTYDAVQLRRLGISPLAVSEAITSARLVQSLGVQRRGAAERGVTLRDQPASLEAVAALPVRGPAGRIFTVGDLATVRADEDVRGRFFRINGQPAVAVEVTRQPNADAIQTAAAVRQAVGQLRPGMPPGIVLTVANDESVDLANELGDLAKRGALAVVAVLLVLVVALRRWRPVALVLGSTLVAIAATALTLYLLHVPANLLTLAGLGMGVGILVQDALIVVNRLSRRPQQAEDSADQRATAAERIAPAVIGSTLTTAVVLVPFLYLQGDSRRAFVPFAAAFVCALGWSLLTALGMVPALGQQLHRARAPWPRLQRAYVRGLIAVLRWRAVALAATVLVLGVLTWGFVEKVPRSSFSGFGERRTTLSAGLSFPRGSDPETIDRAMREFEAIVVGDPTVEQVRAYSNGTTGGQLSVLFTRAGGLTGVPLTMQELLTQRAVLIGGAQVHVFGNGPGFSSGGGGGSIATYRLQVLGYSYAGVERIAEDLQARLQQITRVRDVRITSAGFFGGENGSQVVLEPDRPALARYRLTAAHLAQGVAREVRGAAGRQLLEIGGDELPVTVKAAGARDRSMDELQEALLPTATRAPVRIRDVATVGTRDALSSVDREDQQYLRQVSYDFRGPPKLAERTHAAFMKTLAVPPGYRVIDVTYGTPWEQDDSAKGLWLVFAVGVALVVLTVALVFDSVWSAAMVFLSFPLAVAGVAAAFWATGSAFTREAAVGVILVVGLAVHQAILLIDAAVARRRQQLERGMRPGLSAGQVVRAAADRSGMILLITVASLASLIPLSVGTPADSLFGAIALATAGGTVAGTVGALVVLPLLLVARPLSWSRRQRTFPA